MTRPHYSGQAFRLVVAVLVITVLAVAIQATVWPSRAATNLVVNPGFEDGVGQTPTGWSEWSPNGGEGASYSAADSPHSGAAKAAHWTSGAYEVYTHQLITGLTNGLYTLKAWVRSGGGQTIARLEAKEYGGSLVTVNIPTSDPWVQISITDINVTNNQCRIGFYSVAGAGQWINFDDVEFYLQDAPTATATATATSTGQTVYPTEDTTSFLRNPAMGWALYVEDFGGFAYPDAETYWSEIGPYASKASILYLRLAWARMEPSEGSYIWNTDPNFNALLQGALNRGLKLAFRIYVDSADAAIQATPEWVFTAGATVYTTEGRGFKTPDVSNSVFQAKFTNFVNAFGARYNNPDQVAYIDGNGLGWWGEVHHLDYLSSAQKTQVWNWITSTYINAFPNVLLGEQYGGSFDASYLEPPLSNGTYMIRRDSLGSPQWFTQADKDLINSHWPNVAVYGENCYQNYVNSQSGWGVYYSTVRDQMIGGLNDAEYIHSNVFDLRHPQDVVAWVRDNTDLVDDWNVNGGYRFAAVSVNYPTSITAGSNYSIYSTWKNTGVGMLPNNRTQWNYKYKLAYALLDRVTGMPVYTVVDTTSADPSTWIKGSNVNLTTSVNFSGAPGGTFDLGVALVDRTRSNQPAILLAITNSRSVSGWYILGQTTVGGVTATPGATVTPSITPTPATPIPSSTPVNTPAGMTNSASNIGFESGALSPWSAVGSASVVSGQARTGTYAARLGALNASVEQVVTVSPNTVYMLHGWVRVTVAGETAAIGVKNFNGSSQLGQTSAFTHYTQGRVIFQTDGSTTQATIYCTKNYGSGYAYCDDFEVVNLSAAAPTATPLPPNTWLASAGFSSTQGQNQWYYQQWNGSVYSNLTWNGTNNEWEGSEAYTYVYSDGQHPGTTYDSVRKWVAPQAGSIEITGHAYDASTTCGDGVVVKILKNSSTIWGPQSIANGDTTGYTHDVVTSVAATDAIYFIVNKGTTDNWCDWTGWNPTIVLTSATPTPTPTNTPTRTATPTNTATPSNSGWVAPGANAAATGGDGNGFQTNPANAYSDNATFAVDTDSGTNTNTSCSNTGKDKHVFYTYNLSSVPSGATILGLEVQLQMKVDSTTGTPKSCIELSWDGGTSWTAAKTSSTFTKTEVSYTLGGAADTWGHTWTQAELSNLRVRITNVASNTSRDFSLDWIPVRVTYR